MTMTVEVSRLRKQEGVLVVLARRLARSGHAAEARRVVRALIENRRMQEAASSVPLDEDEWPTAGRLAMLTRRNPNAAEEVRAQCDCLTCRRHLDDRLPGLMRG